MEQGLGIPARHRNDMHVSCSRHDLHIQLHLQVAFASQIVYTYAFRLSEPIIRTDYQNRLSEPIDGTD